MEVGILKGHESWVRCLSFSPDGMLLASSSCDGTVRIWDPETLRQLVSIRAGADGIYSLSFSPDGKYLAWGNYEGRIKLYQVGDWEEVWASGPGQGTAIRAIAFSPDGRFIASGEYPKKVRLWDAKSGEELAILEGHEKPVWGVAFFPDGERLVTTSEDGTVRIWEVPENLLSVLPLGW